MEGGASVPQDVSAPRSREPKPENSVHTMPRRSIIRPSHNGHYAAVADTDAIRPWFHRSWIAPATWTSWPAVAFGRR